LKIYFSCRHYLLIALTICIENEISAGIETYVNQRLKANFIEKTNAQFLSLDILERAKEYSSGLPWLFLK